MENPSEYFQERLANYPEVFQRIDALDEYGAKSSLKDLTVAFDQMLMRTIGHPFDEKALPANEQVLRWNMRHAEKNGWTWEKLFQESETARRNETRIRQIADHYGVVLDGKKPVKRKKSH